MTIHLKPELEALIQQDVERGPYRSVDEFVERAVQMLHDEERLFRENKKVIHEAIGEGLAQLDRGEGVPGDVSRARLQEKGLPGLTPSNAAIF
jgi:antitoxin ParD1/3/4